MAKNGYIEFCKMLDEIDFELVGDYTNATEKIELTYKLDNDIKLNISSDSFKRSIYKSIINFKNDVIKSNDRFIRFIGLTNKGSLISLIKTFDGGIIDIDISRYKMFANSRIFFYNRLKEVNGCTTDYYKGIYVKIDIFVDNVRLNPMCPNTFRRTHKIIVNFKNQLSKDGDKFIKFVGLTNGGNLIAQIRTFDNGEIKIDTAAYSKFIKARQSTYDYCKSKGYKILSPYLGALEKNISKFPLWT